MQIALLALSIIAQQNSNLSDAEKFHSQQLQRIQATVLEIEATHEVLADIRQAQVDEVRTRLSAGYLVGGLGLEVGLGVFRFRYGSGIQARLNPVGMRGFMTGLFAGLSLQRFNVDSSNLDRSPHEPLKFDSRDQLEPQFELDVAAGPIGFHQGGGSSSSLSNNMPRFPGDSFALGPVVGIGGGFVRSTIHPGASMAVNLLPTEMGGRMFHFINLMKKIRRAIEQDDRAKVEELSDQLISDWAKHRPFPLEVGSKEALESQHPLSSYASALDPAISFRRYGFSFVTRCQSALGLLAINKK